MTSSALSDETAGYPIAVRTILEQTEPLTHPRGDRLPLLLWPAHGGVVEDEATQRKIIRELDSRGVAVIATWQPSNREKSLADSMRVARIQQEMGLPVCVDANSCMYGFFNEEPNTAYVDEQGETFFDPSIPGGRIGCPFRIDHRYEPVKEQIEVFVQVYKNAKLPLDFVFGDWEIDGPLEINRAWESAKRCVITRKHIPDIDDFRAFQKAVRDKRSEATRICFSEPLLSRYPKALVGNYGVYPNDGYRYWYDYFEVFVDYHPHKMEQRAPYREWRDDWPDTGYTFAMPVVYPWARIFGWYDFANSDYRWLYNMLKVATNAAKNTDRSVPIIPFVHYHTIFHPEKPDSAVSQMSEWAYQELLWHMLLRGVDTFFLWCTEAENEVEVRLLHEVWAASLEYAEFLNRGEPVTFDLPSRVGTVVSGLRLGDQVLIRRSDFDDESKPASITIDGRALAVPKTPGRCQILSLD